VERRHIAAILESCNGNVTHAARILGIDRVTLYNKIRKYGLRVGLPRFRGQVNAFGYRDQS
jgi:transcriptional regulator of acetoin/glycerol metabolism